MNDIELINKLRLLNELTEEYEVMGEEISDKYKLLLDMGERWGMKRNGNWLFID